MKETVLLILVAGYALGDNQSPRLFWTDKDDGKIETADSDGGNRVTVFSNLTDPRGIAVDPITEKIYWASHTSNGALYRANCDGTDQEIFIGSLNEPADLLLDLENRFIYWAAEGANAIQKADIDGTREVSTVLSGLNRPYYLALDGDFIYWSDFNSSIIHRANTDGTNPTNFITGQSRVRDIEIADGFIYWCDRNSSDVKRRELVGAGPGTTLFSGGIGDRPHGLFVDPISNTMFWTDTETQRVSSGAIDGSGSVTNLPIDNLNGPWAITFTRPSEPTDPLLTWKSKNFTAAELADPLKEASTWGNNADPDSDGSPNLLEYAQGTDPESPLVSPGTVSITSGEKVRIVFRIRANDPALTFTMETTGNLNAEIWDSNSFQEVGERQPDPTQSTYELVTMEADPQLSPGQFARLRISR